MDGFTQLYLQKYFGDNYISHNKLDVILYLQAKVDQLEGLSGTSYKAKCMACCAITINLL